MRGAGPGVGSGSVSRVVQAAKEEVFVEHRPHLITHELVPSGGLPDDVLE